MINKVNLENAKAAGVIFYKYYYKIFGEFSIAYRIDRTEICECAETGCNENHQVGEVVAKFYQLDHRILAHKFVNIMNS